MKTQINILLFLGLSLVSFSQSKKQVKEHKIKTTIVVTIENGKTINENKTVFDAKGHELEVTDYTKEGNLKAVHKYAYNSEGDEIEDAQYDANNKLTEKKTTKYNSKNDKVEENYFDASGKLTKKHLFVYDGKNLKTERKTTDTDGKIVSVKKYNYLTK